MVCHLCEDLERKQKVERAAISTNDCSKREKKGSKLRKERQTIKKAVDEAP